MAAVAEHTCSVSDMMCAFLMKSRTSVAGATGTGGRDALFVGRCRETL